MIDKDCPMRLTLPKESEIKHLIDIFIKTMYTYDIQLRRQHETLIYPKQDSLGLYKSITRNLCSLLSYCYEKQFCRYENTIISSGPKKRDQLEDSDIVKIMYQQWLQCSTK